MISAVVAIIAASFWYFTAENEPKIAKSDDFAQKIIELSVHLERLWVDGDLKGGYSKGQLNCPKWLAQGEKIHFSYFQCNPYFMLCKMSLKKEQLGFKFLKHKFVKNGNIVLTFKHNSSGKKASFTFKDTCSWAKLPEKVYSAAPYEESPYLWDNFGREFSIQRNYVNEGEVKIWKDEAEIDNKISAESFHKPSLDLSLEEKKQYCNFIGGQLLQSRHFDAATFLPSRGDNNYVYKFPYPWTKRVDGLSQIEEKDCDKIFSKECVGNYQYHGTYSPSWMGIYHSLGGYAEGFDAKMFPAGDLKLSSMDYNLDSPWHRLGFRGSSENKREIARYNRVALEAPLEKVRSAFRCVKY